MSKPRVAAVLAIVALAGCSASGTLAPAAPALPARAPAASLGTIKHVVIIVQENRTFDNIFAGYPGAESKMYGYTHTGKKLALHPTNFNGPDIVHSWGSGIWDRDGGKMDRFDNNVPVINGRPALTYPYAYLERTLVAPYWTMAQRYVLADHMFPTMIGPSFTAHLDLVASTANLDATHSLIDQPSEGPWGCDAPPHTATSFIDSALHPTYNGGPFPCLTQFKTLADTLDAAGVSWKFYAPAPAAYGGKAWSPFAAIRSVRRGPDWTRNVITPQTAVLTDPGKGGLPSVSWVTPDSADSDHAGSNSDTGPSWVAAVVNAVGESKYWNSTAIVVVWDDWGGWYDDLDPPQADFRGLGIRVPCLVISPYAKKHYVSQTPYEFGSIVKFVEQTFNLPALATLGVGTGYTDARANSLLDSFDFTQAPRTFVPIPAPYKPQHFLTQPPSKDLPDNE